MDKTSPHVLILYKSEQCHHCRDLVKKWDSEDKNKVTVISEVKKKYPNIRHDIVDSKNGSIDLTKYPKDILRFNGWFPMVLLIPGHSWDNVMANLGTEDEGKLENVEVLNGNFDDDGVLTYTQKYNMMEPQHYVRWISDVMKSSATKKHTIPINNPIIKPYHTMIPKNTTEHSIEVCDNTMNIIGRPYR